MAFEKLYYKMDMKAANKSLRDLVDYICNPISSHPVGSKNQVYPGYDFTCPYVDSIEVMTHAFYSSEYNIVIIMSDIHQHH